MGGVEGVLVVAVAPLSSVLFWSFAAVNWKKKGSCWYLADK